ncbi:MAG TPA: methyltransferase domain-containing protein [Chitinophagales bacterium]|nr:methyltransferase domain-containing protein [Chitinophagales bacterium]
MESAFDAVAKQYDNEFSYSAVGKAQRACVWRHLGAILPSKKVQILEMNCGTGEDAIRFIKLGHSVLLTDVSNEMVTTATNKLEQEGLTNFTTSIWNLKDTFPLASDKYDLIFSNFGGWNCLSKSELMALATQCEKLLSRDGKIVAVVMGRKCLWEKWYFRFKHKPEEQKRRLLTTPSKARLDKVTAVDTWYYSPDEIAQLFSGFAVTKIKPIGLFIPPSYLNPFFSHKLFLLKILTRLDKLFSFSKLSNYADHFLIVLEKKNN